MRPILVDLDEVVFPFLQTWDKWLLETQGKSVDWDAFVWWYDLDLYLSGHLELMGDFLKYEGVRTAQPIPEALAALKVLSERYTIVACTARNEEEWKTLTRAWVGEHLPFVENIVHVRRDAGGPAVPKGDIALVYRATALIDDTAFWMDGLPSMTNGYVLKRPAPLASDPGAQDWSHILESLIGRA